MNNPVKFDCFKAFEAYKTNFYGYFVSNSSLFSNSLKLHNKPIGSRFGIVHFTNHQTPVFNWQLAYAPNSRPVIHHRMLRWSWVPLQQILTRNPFKDN